MPIHAYIKPIHICTHMHAHTSIYIYIYIYIYTCAYTHSCACVYRLPFVDGRWDGKGVQDPKGYATARHKHSQNLSCY